MNQPWKRAIKAFFIAIVFLFFICMILFTLIARSGHMEWALLWLCVCLGSLLTGMFVYQHARIQALESRLEYLEEKLEKLKNN